MRFSFSSKSRGVALALAFAALSAQAAEGPAPMSTPAAPGVLAPPAAKPLESAIVDGFRIGDYVGVARRGFTNLGAIDSLLGPLREGQPFKEKAADLLLLTNCKQKLGGVAVIQVMDQYPLTASAKVAVPAVAPFSFSKISEEAASSVCSDKISNRFPLAQSVPGANWQPLISAKGRALFVNVPDQVFKPNAKLDFLVFALATPAGIPEKLQYAVDVVRFKGQCGKSFEMFVEGKDPAPVKAGTLFDQTVVQPMCSKDAAKAAGYGLVLNLQ